MVCGAALIHLDMARMGRVVLYHMYSGFCSALDSEHLELSINMKEDKNVHFFLLLENENHLPVCPTTPLTPQSPQLT